MPSNPNPNSNQNMSSVWQSIAASAQQQIQAPPHPPPPPWPTDPQPDGLVSAGSGSVEHVEIYGSYYSGKKMIKKVSGDQNKIYNIPFYTIFPQRGGKQDGEVGLEIECEGTNLFDAPIKWWQTHSDNSLRDVKDHHPIEYVLRKPIYRKEVPDALSYLTKKLKEAGSSIQMSYRTSVHVHVNCQDLTIKQIYQFICLYVTFEELLVEFSGPDRAGNLFCLRGKDSEAWIQNLEAAIQHEDFNIIFSDNYRYTACNTASLGKFGSLEFRSLRGTVDQELIQDWVDILLLLKDQALKFSDPKEIVETFSRLGPLSFFNTIFKDLPKFRGMYQYKPGLHQTLWDGLRLMRDVAYAVKWEKRDESLVQKKKEPLENSQSFTNGYGPTFSEMFGLVDRFTQVRQGVYITYYISDPNQAYLENYNYRVESLVPTFGSTVITIGVRHRYRIMPDGMYDHAYWVIPANETVYDQIQ